MLLFSTCLACVSFLHEEKQKNKKTQTPKQQQRENNQKLNDEWLAEPANGI